MNTSPRSGLNEVIPLSRTLDIDAWKTAEETAIKIGMKFGETMLVRWYKVNLGKTVFFLRKREDGRFERVNLDLSDDSTLDFCTYHLASVLNKLWQ